MRKTAFALFFGFWPLLLGVFLPYFQFPGGTRFLNFFWSVIDGLCLWAIDESVGLSVQSRLLILGAFVWPIVISGLMLLVGFRISRMPSKARLIALSLLLASSLLTVNLRSAQHPPLSHLPTYYRLFFAVW